MQPVRASLILAIVFVLAGVAQDASRKVTKAEALEAAIAKPQPAYPVVAKQLKLSGAVEVEAVISESGSVEKVNIVSGNPVLTKPVADAVKNWKFKPFQVEGKPTKVLAPISFAFKSE